MKIIQLLARIEGSGVTRYVIELNKAFKMCGYDVEVAYLDPHLDNGNASFTGQTIDNIVRYDWSDETVRHLNEADLVIINSIIDRKSEYRDTWIDLVQNKIKTKKVIVINDHKVPGFRAYYGDLLKRKDFWMSFDKICIFSYYSPVYEAIIKAIGESEALLRYMHLEHPFVFDDSIKDKWAAPQDKLRRLCYFGRHAVFKDEIRMLRGRDAFWNHDWELEMRGVRCVINLITIPDFKYIVGDDGKPVNKVPYVKGDKYELSPYTYWCDDNRKLRKMWGISRSDLMIDHPEREKNRIYIFGAYKHDDAMDMMRRYAFSCDFYNLDTDKCYGDNMEYTVFEMVQNGSIPVLDTHAGNSIHVLKPDGTYGYETLASMDAGIFLDKDLSNIEYCVSKMDMLYDNPDKYDELRNHIYDVYKQHTDPVVIVKNFMKMVNLSK